MTQEKQLLLYVSAYLGMVRVSGVKAAEDVGQEQADVGNIVFSQLSCQDQVETRDALEDEDKQDDGHGLEEDIFCSVMKLIHLQKHSCFRNVNF